MKCSTARRELESFRNRDCSESLRGQIEEHFKCCEPCRKYFEEWENLAGLRLEREVPAIPEDLTQRILEAIPQTHLARGKRDSRYKPRRTFFWKALPIAVAAEIAILLLLNFLVLRPAGVGRRESKTPVVATVVDVQGDVSVSTVDGWKKLVKGDSVRAFTTVHTAPSANTRVRLTDGSVIGFGSETSMTLLGVTGEARAHMTFDEGEAHFYVAEAKGKFLVDVPPVGRRIMVLGTEFKLRLEKEGGDTDMEITRKMGKLVACTLVVTVLSGEVLAETMNEDQGLRIAAGETERLLAALSEDTGKAETKEAEPKEAEGPSWKRKINKILDEKKVSIFFTETPLSKVLQFFGDLTKIDFVADLEEGVDPLVTIRVNSMRLRNVLNWIAKLSKTKWELKDEAIYFNKDIENIEPVLAKKRHDTAAFGESTITINGKTIRTSGSNITVNNNTVIVDGKVLSESVIKGSGKIANESRNLSNFNELRLDISASVTVTKGKKAKCVITADDNILPLILTECSGNALRISAKESYSSTRKITIAVETPLITRAELNGSGKIDVTEVTKDKLALVISGSGDIIAKGKVAELRATINGSGDVHAASLEAGTATITINGSGDADIHATDILTAKVRGSGDITYIGTPSKVHTSVSGSGKIAKKETE